MPTTAYDLPVRDDATGQIVSRWVILALLSLVAAGIFSVLLVLARTPVIQSLTPFVDFFHVALVVHVNLSVLVWLLAKIVALLVYIGLGAVCLRSAAGSRRQTIAFVASIALFFYIVMVALTRQLVPFFPRRTKKESSRRSSLLA